MLGRPPCAPLPDVPELVVHSPLVRMQLLLPRPPVPGPVSPCHSRGDCLRGRMSGAKGASLTRPGDPLQVGLFRKSGVKSRIQALRQMNESFPDNVSYEEQSAYDVADMVKQFFRDLPEPLFTNKLSETFLHIYQCEWEEHGSAFSRRLAIWGESCRPRFNYTSSTRTREEVHDCGRSPRLSGRSWVPRAIGKSPGRVSCAGKYLFDAKILLLDRDWPNN